LRMVVGASQFAIGANIFRVKCLPNLLCVQDTVAVLNRKKIFRGLVVIWLLAIDETLLPNVRDDLQMSDDYDNV